MIWWVDETTTNLHERLHRVWQKPGRLLIRKAGGQRQNVTIIGALSSHGGKLFAKLAPTTNAEEVESFFLEMAARHDLRGSVVCLDNHRAHLSRRVKELFQELQCQLFFLPPASSQLNPIEVSNNAFTRLTLIVFPLDIVVVGKKVVPPVIASRRNTEADSGLDGT